VVVEDAIGNVGPLYQAKRPCGQQIIYHVLQIGSLVNGPVLGAELHG
jgi:hypothetical protein